MQPVIEGAWTVLAAANRVLTSLSATPPDGSPVAACNDRESAPWTFLTNAAPGAQLHEHLAHAVREATVKDSKDAITRTALIIFVVMIASIVVAGIGVILPNLFAVQRLQNELVAQLVNLPAPVRQASVFCVC